MSGRQAITGPDDLLAVLLPGVSRSFALSLRVLPASLRRPLGVTYLLARAADTVADTAALLPAERRAALERLRSVVRGEAECPVVTGTAGRGQPVAERDLLARLPEVVAEYRRLRADDQARSRTVLLALTEGMLETLARFPPEDAGRVEALETRADLARYTYLNAGCVGEFWTDTAVAHRPRCAGWNLPRMRALGVRFGHGLELVNVLRDLPRDLRTGRCLIPRVDLDTLGLVPADLLDPAATDRLRPLVRALVGEARAHLEAGLAYTLAVPRLEAPLRLACAWPLLIGLSTLRRIASADDLLDPAVVVKVPRATVRRHLVVSGALALSNRGLAAYARRLAAPLPSG